MCMCVRGPQLALSMEFEAILERKESDTCYEHGHRFVLVGLAGPMDVVNLSLSVCCACWVVYELGEFAYLITSAYPVRGA